MQTQKIFQNLRSAIGDATRPQYGACSGPKIEQPNNQNNTKYSREPLL
jgi:hypothetical protein